MAIVAIKSWYDDRQWRPLESSAPADTAAATGTDDHADEGADTTELTTSAEGRIDSDDDVDYFRIDIPKRLAVTVHTTGNLDTVGQLEDASGAELDSDDNRGEGNHFLLSADLDPGRYYVRVTADRGDAGSYTVHLDTAEIDPSLSLSLGGGQQISSAVYHTCGLRADGTAVCWGKDEDGRATPPTGERFWVE